MPRSVGAILLMLPGAVLLGGLGVLTSAFASDNSAFMDSSWKYAFFWGGVGGASLGASPGIAYGLYHRRRWVYPIFGTAVCALMTLGIDATGFSGQDVNNSMRLYTGLLVVGMVAGGIWWYVATGLANKRKGADVKDVGADR